MVLPSGMEKRAQAAEEGAGPETGVADAGQVGDDDVDQAAQVHDADELDERQQHFQPVVGHGVGHEGKNADGRVEHDHAGDADHDFAHGIEEGRGGPGLVAAQADGHAHQHGEEDDLQDVALGQGIHGVQGHDAHEHFHQRRRGHFPGAQVGGGKVEAHTGLEDVAQDKADGHGQGRGGEIEGQGLGGDPAQTAHIAHAGGAGDQGGQHQRHDDHADEIDEQVAEGFEEGGADAHPGGQRAHQYAQNHADAHLQGQAHFFAYAHRNLTACCVV